MGVSYIVYCSGHFSKKAPKIVLRLTVVILALGPKNNETTRIIIVATNFEHKSYISTVSMCVCDYVLVIGENATSFGHQFGRLSLELAYLSFRPIYKKVKACS